MDPSSQPIKRRKVQERPNPHAVVAPLPPLQLQSLLGELRRFVVFNGRDGDEKFVTEFHSSYRNLVQTLQGVALEYGFIEEQKVAKPLAKQLPLDVKRLVERAEATVRKLEKDHERLRRAGKLDRPPRESIGLRAQRRVGDLEGRYEHP